MYVSFQGQECALWNKLNANKHNYGHSIECFDVTSCCPPTWLLTLSRVMVSPWTSPFMVQAHWWSHARMVRVSALQVSLCNPTAMLEDSMTSVKMLYCDIRKKVNTKSIICIQTPPLNVTSIHPKLLYQTDYIFGCQARKAGSSLNHMMCNWPTTCIMSQEWI